MPNDVDSAEDELVTDDAPSCTAFLARGQSLVESVFLLRAHKRAASMVVDIVDVVSVPV